MKLKRYIQRHWSKNSIAFKLFDEIIKRVPNHQDLIFVDLFWWGGAMSSNSTYFFKDFIYNEIDKWVSDLFIAVQNDDFIKNLKEKWISREEFFEIKNKENRTIEEEMILNTWSFWNNRRSYIYWKTIENRKYLTHKIINSKTEEEYKKYIKRYNEEKAGYFNKYWAEWCCFLLDNDFNDFINSKNKRYYKFWKQSDYYRKFYKWFDMKLFIEKRWKHTNKQDIDLLNDLKRVYQLEELEKLDNLNDIESLEILESLARLESLQILQSLARLESLEILERIERIERLERLEIKNIFNLSYENVKFPAPDECIIYLDPPYKWTLWYWQEFDYEKLYNYILELKEKWYKIFVSEYNLPFWEVIWSKTKRWFISQIKDNHSWLEKLYLI